MYFTEGDVVGGKCGVVGDCFRVNEETTIVLRFEGFIVVSVCVGRIIKEDKSKAPNEGLFFIRLTHINYILRYNKNH
jgi:hypothetical protein